jgi:hypothetical protein
MEINTEIKIKFNEATVKLDHAQARELMARLQNILGCGSSSHWWLYPTLINTQPRIGEVTCSSNEIEIK